MDFGCIQSGRTLSLCHLRTAAKREKYRHYPHVGGDMQVRRQAESIRHTVADVGAAGLGHKVGHLDSARFGARYAVARRGESRRPE